MGKYLPVIKTAECGSLTRAAHLLGYTQPSLGYIINNIEDELGVKLFYRDQRGVTLTEAGAPLLEIMKKIEAMEDHLRQMARAGAGRKRCQRGRSSRRIRRKARTRNRPRTARNGRKPTIPLS